MTSTSRLGTVLALRSVVDANPSRPWTRSLGAQLVLGFLLVSLIPVALTAALMAWQNTVVAERFARETVQKTANAYASGLDLFVERQRGRLRDLDMVDASPEALGRAVAADPNLEALWFAGSPEGAEPAPADWALDACRSLAKDAGSVMTHAGEGHAHEVVLAVDRGGRTLCGQITFTLHQDMMTEQANSFLGGSAYIVDRSGVVVCHSFEEDEPHVARGAVLSASAVDVASEGRAWAGSLDADGERLAAFASASELPWGVWVEVPADVAVRPLREGLLQALVYSALVALMAGVVALFLARRLAAPVRQVAEGVRRLADGDHGQPVPVGGPSEVATLAADFNRMSDALARSRAELEDRVDTRTRELRDARAFSDRLLDTMHQRIVVIDRDRRIVRANRAALEAWGADLVGRDCSVLHGGGRCVATEVLQGGVGVRDERILTRDGHTEILACETLPLTGQEKSPHAVLVSATDVTEVTRMRTRLAHQEKMAAVGTLAAGLAHEIGNPLASLSSELEMLERAWDPDDARDALPVLRDQIRRMSGLLRELVDFGRPVSDVVASVDVGTLLSDVVRLLGHDPRARGVALEQVLDGDPGELVTSRDRLLQVLLNLGLNALDAVDGEGRVRFSARPDPLGGVRIEVSDTGPGLPDEVAGQAFDPFFTTKAPGVGTGLGLFVSERIVEGLGGRIELRSTTRGATFAVILPRAPAESS